MPTLVRAGVRRALQSILDGGLTEVDEVICVVDMELADPDKEDELRWTAKDIGLPVRIETPFIKKAKPGYPSELRNFAHELAVGEFITYMDDDDVYTPGALATIKERVAEHPGRAGVFRIRYPNGTLRWKEPKKYRSNVGGHCIVPPNLPGLPPWLPMGHAGTQHVEDCARKFAPAVWHEDVIVELRP